ncbi:MAG: hypothetical protein ACI9MR_004739 [Myxococcota bacterium]|jgi:hypothetical protein
MTCEEFQRQNAPGTALTENSEAAAHSASCPACAAVVASRTAFDADDGLDFGAMFAAVEEDIAAETGTVAWLRSRSTPSRRGILLGVTALVAIFTVLASSRVDLSVYPIQRMLIELGALAVLAATVTALAVRSQLLVTRGRVLLLGLGLAIAAPLILSALPAAHAAMEASTQGMGADFAKRAIGCLIWGLIMAAPVLIVAFVLRRSTEPDPARDVVMGAAAGLTGVISLALHCPLTGPQHIAAGHGPVVLVVVGLFVAASFAWSRVRSRTA